jgi:tetratricopeptide (TPR) repeat protein
LAYLVIVAPNLGVIQITRQFAADRYSYVSHMGLAAVLAAGSLLVIHRLRRPGLGGAAAGAIGLAVVAALVPLSWRQSATWSSSEALWTHALRQNGADVPEIRNHLAVALDDAGRSEEAERHLRDAVELNPRFSDALHNLGALLAKQGRFREADELFVRALAVNPNHAAAHMNHGTILVRDGRTTEGLRAYVRALELDPEVDVPSRLRSLLLGRSDFDRALAPLIWPLVDNPGDARSLEALKRALDGR